MTYEDLESALRIARKAARSRNPNTKELAEWIEKLVKEVRRLEEAQPI